MDQRHACLIIGTTQPTPGHPRWSLEKRNHYSKRARIDPPSCGKYQKRALPLIPLTAPIHANLPLCSEKSRRSRRYVKALFFRLTLSCLRRPHLGTFTLCSWSRRLFATNRLFDLFDVLVANLPEKKTFANKRHFEKAFLVEEAHQEERRLRRFACM